MISLSLAESLKQAGLDWQPKLHDFFAIPATELAERVFVVADMMIDVDQFFDQKIITFNGAVEWSLDYVLLAETVWIPTETQLRKVLQDALQVIGRSQVVLVSSLDSCLCRISLRGQHHDFIALTAENAYGKALLFILEQRPRPIGLGNGPSA